MDGNIANLPEVVKIAKEFDLTTYMDDAHTNELLDEALAMYEKVGKELGIIS